MTKTTTNGSVNFHANVKTYQPPVIVDQFVDDSGELNYVLANGNTTLQTAYNNLWKPIKTQVNWKAKGDRLDSRQII